MEINPAENLQVLVQKPTVEVSPAVRVRTDEFLDMLFPPLETILRPVERPDENAIIQKHVLLYAKQGQGKTETANFLVGEAIRRYGVQNVSHASTRGENFRFLISRGFWDTPVNVLILEDITDVKLTSDDMRDFFRIRHKMRELTGRQNGYVLMLITGHRFHDIPLPLRTDVDFVLFKESPTNDYDYHVVKRFVGEHGIRLLSDLESKREVNPAYKGFAYLTAKRRRIGMVYTPKESMTYLKEFHGGTLVQGTQLPQFPQIGTLPKLLFVLFGGFFRLIGYSFLGLLVLFSLFAILSALGFFG